MKKDMYLPSHPEDGEDEDDGPESEDLMVLLQKNRQK